MKFSRKLIFLAVVLIVVSIISMYFGSVKSIEGVTIPCPTGSTCSVAPDAAGILVMNITDPAATTATTTPTTPTPTAPAAATCTGIVCAPKVSDCKSKAAYSNQTCCATQASKKTACKP